VFSPESWVEDLHRHFADHGGARVRQIVLDPALALEEEYDTLVVSHRWPALTRAFVEAVHARSRRVLGVFDPDEPAGRDHLAALGVDATVAAGAPADEFVDALAGLAPTRDGRSAVSERLLEAIVGPVAGAGAAHPSGRITGVGGPPGSGATEVAIELTRAI